MKKPKIAFFDFSCCEGCQLQIANFGEELLEILKYADVVEFREVMSEKSEHIDVALVEGSITTPHGIERIKAIRARVKILIAYGACATIGGINGMKNKFDLKEIKEYVYKDKADCFETVETMPVHQVVKVDYYINGCPVYPPEIIKILKHVLAGLPYNVCDHSVCVECKLNENECMYDKGLTCLGPITKAGCNSWCLNNNNICYGCRGMVTNPAKNAQMDVLKKYNIPLEWIINKMDMYNKASEREGKKQNG